jgi:alkylation response protein AidB-like acyl-CoA dehydrogenase
MFSYEDHQERVELYEYTLEQYETLKRIRVMGEKFVGPAARRIDREGVFPIEGIEALRESGFIGLCVPREYGGQGAGYRGDVVLLPLVLMELASWCSSTSQVFALHNTGVQLVHAMGDAGQRNFFFREALQGHMFGSFGSETNANRFALNSSVRYTGNGYVLNGRKHFATASTGAKWAYWRSVSEDAAGTQDERYMMPIVQLSAPGVTIIDDWDGIGQRGTGSGTVIAENVFIPEAHVTGGPGAYSKHGSFFAAQFHLNFAAQFVGIATGAYREALRYIKEQARPWPGVASAGEDPYIQLRVADMAVKLASARQLVLRAARLLQAYEEHPELRSSVHAAVSQAKISATQASLEVTSDVFQVMGARAATQKYGIDLYYRNARTLTLHDPVDRQREAVGKYELGIEAHG